MRRQRDRRHAARAERGKRTDWAALSRDLNLVRLFSDRVMVMYLGRVVEVEPVDRVFEEPRHPYTRALPSAIPLPDPATRRMRIALRGEPSRPVDPPLHVCRFYGRCPDGVARCAREMPPLRAVADGPEAACHLLEATSASAVTS